MNKILILLLLILSACGSGQIDSGVYTKSATVENLLSRSIRSPWQEITNNGSDLALANKSSKSFFLFNSSCRKYEASNLNSLTTSMLSGINNIEYIEKSTVVHQEREAVLIIAKGSIDGVVRYLRILTTQKNYCIYDYALIATSLKNLEKDTADFNKFIQLLVLN